MSLPLFFLKELPDIVLLFPGERVQLAVDRFMDAGLWNISLASRSFERALSFCVEDLIVFRWWSLFCGLFLLPLTNVFGCYDPPVIDGFPCPGSLCTGLKCS